MRVILRHAGIGLYYAGRRQWVNHPESALDLETIERATELGREESFGEMEIVVTYDDPCRELVLPLRDTKRKLMTNLCVMPLRCPIVSVHRNRRVAEPPEQMLGKGLTPICYTAGASGLHILKERDTGG